MPYLWPFTISCFPNVSVKYIFSKLKKVVLSSIYIPFLSQNFILVLPRYALTISQGISALIFANFPACLLCNFLTVKSVSLAPVPPFISTNLVPHFAGGNNFFLHSFLCHLIVHWRRKNYLLLKLNIRKYN